jgi:glycosyltransferase involved in cell wall biosynthesis
MPVYNGSKYLRPAIDSILGQNFRDFELIIVNDGSTDDTLEIAKSYTDKRIVLLSHENQGVARSLNKALKIARGKYIRRHDADDVSLPDDLKVQVDFLVMHPEFALVSSQIAYMTDRGKKAGLYRNPKQDFFSGKEYVEVDFELYKMSRPVIHATVLMLREVLLELGGYRTDFLTSEDIDLWLRFLDNHRIAVLNQCHYYVRLHHNSATRRHSGSVNFYRDLAFRFAEQRREHGKDDLEAGLPMPLPEKSAPEPTAKNPANGRYCREDLQFYYNILVDSGDVVNLRKTASTMIRDGWKVGHTWKMIVFPWIGPKVLNSGIRVKHWLHA